MFPPRCVRFVKVLLAPILCEKFVRVCIIVTPRLSVEALRQLDLLIRHCILYSLVAVVIAEFIWPDRIPYWRFPGAFFARAVVPALVFCAKYIVETFEEREPVPTTADPKAQDPCPVDSTVGTGTHDPVPDSSVRAEAAPVQVQRPPPEPVQPSPSEEAQTDTDISERTKPAPPDGLKQPRQSTLTATQTRTRPRKRKAPFDSKTAGQPPADALRISTSGITVAVRVTPACSGAQLARYQVNGNSVISGPAHSGLGEGDERNFHHVFPSETDNEGLHRALLPLYYYFMATPGTHSAVIADGYSGSGKSHTLIDRPDSILPQLTRLLLSNEALGRGTVLFAAAQFAYAPAAKDQLKFMYFSNTGAVEHHSWAFERPWNGPQYVVSDMPSAMAMIEQAKAFRKTEATAINDQSSRSHMVSAFTVTFRGGTYSTLFLVDLAGNERHGSEEWDPARQKEGTWINSNRNSVLRILQDLQKDPNASTSGEKILSILKPCFTGPGAVLFLSHVNEGKSYESTGSYTLDVAGKLSRTRAQGVEFIPHHVTESDEEAEEQGPED